MMFYDIDQPAYDYGWFNNAISDNRQTFNGFADYTAGRNPCGQGSNPNDVSQWGVYSAPSSSNGWDYAMGTGTYGSIPNAYVWTKTTCCQAAFPGANWGGRAVWFGGSSYNWSLQFDENPDYDDAYEPDYLPVFGTTLGY
jgi:hypothetical protein